MKPEKFLEHFSNHLKNALARGISLAGGFGHSEVTPAHLLAALGEERGSLAAEILLHFHCEPKRVMYELQPAQQKQAETAHTETKTLPELSAASKRALEKAMLAAYERSQNHVGTEHLLYGILTVRDPSAEQVLGQLGVDRLCLEEEVEMTLQGQPVPDDPPLVMPGLHHARPATAREVFTVELTAKKIHETLDPVIGRDKEIERLIRILSRRTKNNPVLVGEPGVGKTAIVEGLAKRIVSGDVPDLLKKKRVISLDLALLVAGTMYRGEFEARLKQLIEEISANPDTILFIDEIHNIIGTGSNQGTMDVANILKPALARGLLHCIGATTLDEYQKHMSEDPALERRFQPVYVDEPSSEDTIKILQGLRRRYENFHGVRITDEAIYAAVSWGNRYIHDAFLPDKAIDLLDEAAAAVRLAEKKSTKKSVRPAVSNKTIARILSAKLSVSEDRILMNDWEHLDAVEGDLRGTIIGQDHAIDEILRALRRSALGVGHINKPRASFLFVGPSGVGKTVLAKTLAKALYHDERALVRLDMTEFSEAHSVSKLLGSPAGYVGYKERNRFLEELKKRPSSVLVFDEFDKAHPDVQKTLFQILDEGVLRTSDGKSISFRHTIVILTANIGEELYTASGIGFGNRNAGTVDASIRAKIKDQLGRNLTDRIEHVLLFQPLMPETVAKIIANAFEQFSTELKKERNINIVPDVSVLKTIAEETANAGTGARSVERRVSAILEDAAIDLARQAKRRKKAYTLSSANGKFLLT